MTQQHLDALRKSAANQKKQRDTARKESERIAAERDAALKLQDKPTPRQQ